MPVTVRSGPGTGQDEAAGPLFHALDDLPDGDRAELLAGDRLEGWVLDTLRTHLPETHVVVEQSEEPEGEFGWVTDDQVTVLAGAWGGAWPGLLSADLDERWGEGWQAHPAEHKAAWLGELVASGVFTGDGASGDVQLVELAEVIRQVPGYDQLSPEQLAAAIAAAE